MVRFLLAWSIRDQRDLDGLRRVLPFPLRVLRLTAPIEVIRSRLATEVSVGRQRDLRNAERWLSNGTGSDLAEESVISDRPIREVANEILDLLGWR